ncbi:hypothetical protein L1987_80337 [Smallanthus sonchifolius]|uniref:Uncharacterized protein n=1 Tax=Smallanthus sonchifolius TaxID=185202 RepID=A0ACB8YLN1_9ASTR|nr:hypothetical protein L1987_80337 [Smallanthus sonchifolius]
MGWARPGWVITFKQLTITSFGYVFVRTHFLLYQHLEHGHNNVFVVLNLVPSSLLCFGILLHLNSQLAPVSQINIFIHRINNMTIGSNQD